MFIRNLSTILARWNGRIAIFQMSPMKLFGWIAGISGTYGKFMFTINLDNIYYYQSMFKHHTCRRGNFNNFNNFFTGKFFLMHAYFSD